MDRIIVLEDGKIVEEGTHDSLLSQDRLYSKFWKRQSGGFIGIQKNQIRHQK
jgi:ABC-type multidrug transport system fused ATPase/permease subunit